MLPVHLHCFDVGKLAQQHPIRSSNRRTQSPTTELYPDFREASSDHLPHATCSSYCVLGPVPDTRGRAEWVMAELIAQGEESQREATQEPQISGCCDESN